MGVVEGQLGTVVAAYLATGLGVGGLVAWVALGHRARRREIADLERAIDG